jgi:hypothetical protein
VIGSFAFRRDRRDAWLELTARASASSRGWAGPAIALPAAVLRSTGHQVVYVMFFQFVGVSLEVIAVC